MNKLELLKRIEAVVEQLKAVGEVTTHSGHNYPAVHAWEQADAALQALPSDWLKQLRSHLEEA